MAEVGVIVHSYFEKHLAAHGGTFLISDAMTIADFKVGAWYYQVILNPVKKHEALTDALKADLQNYPSLAGYLSRFGEQMQEWLLARPQSTH